MPSTQPPAKPSVPAEPQHQPHPTRLFGENPSSSQHAAACRLPAASEGRAAQAGLGLADGLGTSTCEVHTPTWHQARGQRWRICRLHTATAPFACAVGSAPQPRCCQWLHDLEKDQGPTSCAGASQWARPERETRPRPRLTVSTYNEN